MSSVPADSPWRGAAAAYPQPLDQDELLGVEALVEHVYNYTVRPNPRLNDIIYRNSEDDADIRQRVYRWDMTPYEHVFVHGFEARRESSSPVSTYFNLDHFIHHSGRPLDSSRPLPHAFISTTLNGNWRPRSIPNLGTGQSTRVYRYEIYAPGGVYVQQTLQEGYQYTRQQEITFIGAIARQYIRACQVHVASREPGSSFTRWRRFDDTLIINSYFNPQSHPFRRINIQLPLHFYVAENGRHVRLREINYPEIQEDNREKREINYPDWIDIYDWYVNLVGELPGYINAAFRAMGRYTEAYLFMRNEYVLVNYAPGTTNDKIVNGPILICDGFPSLTGTSFAEHGIDCAFDTFTRAGDTRAYIFSGKLCALIDYAPGSKNDKILEGPMTIARMFPFFKGTVFENCIDAAFKATANNEAYLFKGDQYALINFTAKRRIAIRPINQGFYSFRGTIFERGIDAAFASHRRDEAYIFKGEHYALINFAPGSTNDYIIGGVKKIREHWPSLAPILPIKNYGLDYHVYHDPERDLD